LRQKRACISAKKARESKAGFSDGKPAFDFSLNTDKPPEGSMMIASDSINHVTAPQFTPIFTATR
jgi:hypothetical protein